jgi:hypothetical protein
MQFANELYKCNIITTFALVKTNHFIYLYATHYINGFNCVTYRRCHFPAPTD